MKGTNFVPKGGSESGGWHGWDMWRYLHPDTGDATIRARIYDNLDKARLLRSNVIRIFINVDYWGGVPSVVNPSIRLPFVTRQLDALDQFLWQANEWDMKVIVTLYDGLNTQRPSSEGCGGKLGNRYGSGWQEA